MTSYYVPGFIFDGGTITLLKAAVIFTGINLILVPILKLLLLPLNLLTLGLFAWVANVVALYVLVRLVPAVHISSFYFSGYIIGGFVIPPYEVTTFITAIICSLIIGVFTHLAHWLSH